MRWQGTKVAIWALSIALAASLGLNLGLWVHREDVLYSAAVGLEGVLSDVDFAGHILLDHPTPQNLRAAGAALQDAAGRLWEAQGVAGQEGYPDSSGLATMLQSTGWDIAQGKESPALVKRQAQALASIVPSLSPHWRTAQGGDMGRDLLRELPQVQARLQRAGFR